MTNAKNHSEEECLEIIQSLLAFADKKDWKGLKTLFDEKVVLNYGEPELLSPDEIITQWKPILSYFDSTRHVLKGFEPRKMDRGLLGFASFEATHLKDDRHVILKGSYEIEFSNDEQGKLKISRLRMIPGAVEGEAVLLEYAQTQGTKVPSQTAYTVEVVSFESQGTCVRGWLVAPKKKNKHEVIILGGTWTSIKEQMAYPYAKLLAEAGFTTLVFDFRNFGESKGYIRNLEDPKMKIEDFQAAIDFIKSQGDFNSYCVSLAGICASAGYVAHAASENKAVSRLIMIAPWLHDQQIVEDVYKPTPGYHQGGVQARLSAADAAWERYETNHQIDTVPVASTKDDSAAMFVPDAHVLDFYLNPERGGIPQWENKFAVISWRPWLTFDAISVATKIKIPTLIVHSEEAAIPEGVKKFIQGMQISPEVHWISGSQFDFYDGAEQMRESVGLIKEFIESNPIQQKRVNPYLSELHPD